MRDLFSDEEARAARAGDGLVRLRGGRVLRLPRVMGFCGGVVRALRLLEELLRRKPARQIWLLGEIIHNRTVNEHFRRAGVRILPERETERVFALADPEDAFVMPAFGLPLDFENRLFTFAARPDQIVDTTCPYVKRIWQFVEAAAAAGRTVVIHGKPDHPETRATLSRALGKDNAVVQIPSVAEARRAAAALAAGDWSGYPSRLLLRPERLDPDRVALVNQTTMLYSETLAIAGLLQHAAATRGGEVEVVETVCRATQDRQDAARELCEQGCDLILVLGGFASSNTNQLYRLAAAHAPTFFVEAAAALAPGVIEHYLPAEGRVIRTRDWLRPEHRRLGLLAGASCPAPDIGDVIRVLRRLPEPQPREEQGPSTKGP